MAAKKASTHYFTQLGTKDWQPFMPFVAILNAKIYNWLIILKKHIRWLEMETIRLRYELTAVTRHWCEHHKHNTQALNAH